MKRTRSLIYMSFLTALSIVLMRVMSFRFSIGGIEGIRIGLGSLPIVFAGIAFGPVHGGIVGAVTDIIGYLISPMGGYVPHITLSYFLTGFIPGAITHYIFKSANKYWMILIAVILGQIVTSIILIPYFLFSLFGLPIVTTRVPKIFQVIIEAPVYAYLIKVLLELKPFESLGFSNSSQN